MSNIPPLTGSEKQVAWAETIRLGIVEKFNAAIVAKKATIAAMPDGPEKQAWETAKADPLKRFEAVIRNMTSAYWWIENRRTDWAGIWMADWAGAAHDALNPPTPAKEPEPLPTESLMVKNTGQWHPGIAYVANVGQDLEHLYHGCGKVAITIAVDGVVEGFEYTEVGPKPLPKEGPIEGGKKAIIYGVAGSWQLCIDHGTAGAALLNALEVAGG